MKNIRITVIYNEGRFQQDEYDRLTVRKVSRIEAVQVDGFRPNFLPFFF